ncbi:hypothetical protein GCM10011348_12050 [Marinobacterium nitratireducens]|uniref:DUF3604 domain-containing protein n=1 Tax=Marinobacterium nitratireducens TaxID=518897 RepID=A0A917ZC94_9GAMM|nr:DUF3604 domain-containing protein [Marinobacterium nitratireducens]GGO78951.1 hypothetical protein GCM10011348_12050 [Marinobacterium nitratireducens]
MKKTTLSIAVLASLCSSAFAASGSQSYSPKAGQDYPQQVYWGDTHLHTSYSFDASMMGNKQLGPADAYRFARGEEVEAHNGMVARLDRPLDFLMVSDHSEYLGLIPMLGTGDPELLNDPVGKRWAVLLGGDTDQSLKAMFEIHHDINTNHKSLANAKVERSAWDDIIAAADRYNDPGKFTTFIGYEWTTMPGGDNLHRVVLFADDASKAGQVLPFSSFDSENPEDLWRYLQSYEDKTGGRVLAIPHNGNVSNGLMFALTDRDGNPLSRQYAETRSRWEPVAEVTQIKGDGETHPKLSPEDEFADFETWDKGNLTADALKDDSMLPYEYARSALRLGLQQEAKLGVNPFKFGMIGSTDAHTSLSSGEENNFWGKFSVYEPNPSRAGEYAYTEGRQGKVFSLRGEETAAAGYAAVWATENTRDALFDAMKRRETYATTGPRMTVRFFGGWDFDEHEVERPDYVLQGYRKGVPMGGDLTAAPADRSPRFMVSATRDPEGANLDRVQIVKGWLEADGTTEEKVYDVAWSGERTPDANGKLAPVGDTADSRNATWRNSIGAAELTSVWTDPDFDRAQRAFYYVRVLQIPTPRWPTYDEKHFHYQLEDRSTPEHIQERAYTSPIWYTPAQGTES